MFDSLVRRSWNGKRAIDKIKAVTSLSTRRSSRSVRVRPGPGRLGFGVRAGRVVFARMLRNARRTRAGVSRPGGAGRSQGRRRSSARGRARRSWGVGGDDQPGPQVGGVGVRTFGAVQPRVCLNSRKVCSRSNRRRNACQQPVHIGGGRAGGARTTATPASGRGRRAGARPSAGSTCRGSTGSSPSWSSQAAAAGEPGVHPVPGSWPRRCRSGWSRWRWWLSGLCQVAGLAKVNTPPCLRGGPPCRAAAAVAGVAEHDPVRAQPADQFDGQVGQDVGQAGDVVAGVHDDQDVAGRRRASARPATSRSTTSRSWAAVTAVASSAGPEPDRVQQRGPGGAARSPGRRRTSTASPG